MEDNRTVVEVDAPPEAPLPGSSWIGVALFPFFAVAGLALGLTYGMPWLITSSLAISFGPSPVWWSLVKVCDSF